MFKDIKLIVPGGLGNPALKTEGDSWGATLRFEHRGEAIAVDCGWVLHFGKQYEVAETGAWYWATYTLFSIAQHNDWFPVEVLITSQYPWRNFGFPAGSEISAQACISLAGGISNFVPYGGISPQLSKNLAEVSPVLEKTESKVYRIAEVLPSIQFRNLTVASYT